METISPSVLIGDKTIHPPGWMYVFAMAIRGFPWAEKEVTKPEFDKTVKDWLRGQEDAKDLEEIADLEKQIAGLKASISNRRVKNGLDNRNSET